MDAVTHGLASYALTRTAFPRISRIATIAAILAGVIADVDVMGARFGPSAFLRWYRTYTHSLPAAIVISLAVSAVLIVASRAKPGKDRPTKIFFVVVAAALLHLLMDLSQNERLQVLWPFRSQRFSADLVGHFDLWILLILLAGVLVPKLLAMVTEEIGAKSKAPSGRIGALIALAAVIAYVGARFILHSNALALMESRTYHGESGHSMAALAEPDSPFRWHGIVETERALHDLEVNVGPGSYFNPDAAIVSYKPETSPPLEAAQHTDSVRRFLQVARFPKATVEKTLAGYRVVLRGFPYARDSQSGWRVIAVVETDPLAKITNEELRWDSISRELWWR